jgi:hypothetical protein
MNRAYDGLSRPSAVTQKNLLSDLSLHSHKWLRCNRYVGINVAQARKFGRRNLAFRLQIVAIELIELPCGQQLSLSQHLT